MGNLSSRRETILKILEKKQLTSVAELSEELQVTMETIRKDLLALEEAEKIVRIHGGAALANADSNFVPYSIRKNINSKQKQKVGKKAVELLEEKDIVILENSTTTVALCQELLERPELLQTLTIVTNSFYIAQCLRMGELCSRLLFLGGWVLSSEASTLGHVTTDMLREVRANKAFLSGAALNQNLELTAYYERDMLFQREVLKNAEQTYLLLDSGKYPKSGVLSVAPLSDFAGIVTDIRFTDEQKQQLSGLGVKVVKA